MCEQQSNEFKSCVQRVKHNPTPFTQHPSLLLSNCGKRRMEGGTSCAYSNPTISRLLQIIGLFCKRALQKRQYSAKETYHPTNHVFTALRRIIGVNSSKMKLSIITPKKHWWWKKQKQMLRKIAVNIWITSCIWCIIYMTSCIYSNLINLLYVVVWVFRMTKYTDI